MLFRKTREKRIRNEKEEAELSVFTDPFIVLKKSERFYRQIRINKKVDQKVSTYIQKSTTFLFMSND